MPVAQVLQAELPANGAEQLVERLLLCAQVSLQCAGRHGQQTGTARQARFASWQQRAEQQLNGFTPTVVGAVANQLALSSGQSRDVWLVGVQCARQLQRRKVQLHPQGTVQPRDWYAQQLAACCKRLLRHGGDAGRRLL